MKRFPDPKRGAGGFSLIEVIAAMGLLAGVLLAIAGLFVVGAQQVNSGRSSSEALAVARSVIEEMNGWAFRQCYGLLGETGNAQSYTIDTRDLDPADFQWQGDLERTFKGAWAEIRLESLDGVNLDSTSAIRVTVEVFWTEGPRSRHLALSTVRM